MNEPPAVFLLANDRVLKNVLQLLYSLRVHKFTNKIFYIPFDEETYYLRTVFRSFGVERYNVDLEAIDALGRRIYDRDVPAEPYPYCLGKLRKLSFLTFPAPAVYLDADCVITSTPELFNQIFTLSGPAGIGYINTSPDGVYEDIPAAAALRRRSSFFTSGMIAKSSLAVAVAEVARFFDDSTIENFHQVRRRDGYVDQPLWNFLADSQFLTAVDLLADGRASRATSLAGELSLQPDGTAMAAKMPVLLLHLAGPALKTTTRYRYLLDGMLLGGLRRIAASDAHAFTEMNQFLFAR